MLHLTDLAVQRFKEFLKQGNFLDYGIRIFISSSGWGHSLAMDIAKAAHDGDATFEKDGLKVFLEQKANHLLSNATIDFVDEQGFVITGIPQSPCCS